MTITQTVEIPENHKLVIDVPREVPTGWVEIVYFPAPADDTAAACPICARYRDPKTGELRFNAETVAALRESRAMMRGEIPGQRFNSFDEMMADLMRDDPDD